VADSVVSEILFGGRHRMGKALSAGASLRLRSDHESAVDGRSSYRRTAIFDLRWEPTERLRGVLKYEWTLSESGSEASTSTRNLFAQASLVPIEGLTASFGYKLDDRSAELGGSADNYDGQYFASLLYQRGERLTLFARAERGFSEERLEPYESTLSSRETYLFGASLDVTERWRTLGEVKSERLAGAVAARRRVLVFEVSRSVWRYLRIGAGIELTLDEQGASDRLDRPRAYLKLAGRL